MQIATADQLFAEFYENNPELLFIVGIKNDGEAGREACRILYETLRQYPGYLDRIVIGTFHDEIEEELKTSYPDLLRGASMGTAAISRFSTGPSTMPARCAISLSWAATVL